MYNELLEGLEISVLSLSEVQVEETAERADAEFFQKEFVRIQKFIEIKPFKSLRNVTNKINVGFVGSMVEHYTESGKILIQTKNVDEFFLKLDEPTCIDLEFHEKLSKSQIKRDDILIARSGSFGKASIYLSDEILNSSDIIIVEADNKNVLPCYLVTFLNSNYGVSQLVRFASGGLQGHVNLTILENLNVPILNKSFQQQIEDLVKSAHSTQETSKTLYQEAENLLLSELGIDESVFKVTKNEVVANVKSFADFESSWRLDAEYYQPKYERLENSFKRFDQIAIKNLVNYPVASGTTPKSGDSTFYTDISDGVAFVRAVDIKENRVSINDVNYIRKEVHNGVLKRTKLYKGDVLFSIAGTVGRCGIFESDCEANINQACAILRFDENIVKRLYVILFFNSTIGQTIIEKYARQGVQTNLNLDELANLNIPILPMELQERIIQKIQESFILKTKSEQLLSLAKRAVEIAIEEGEEEAVRWIKGYE